MPNLTNPERPYQLRLGFQAISGFFDMHKRLPRPRNNDNAKEVLRIAEALKVDNCRDIDKRLLTEMAYQAAGDLAPMNSVIGGFAAQEVLKACSGKFHPLHQHLYFDSVDSLPDAAASNPTEEDCAPQNSRYDAQIAVFGEAFQRKIAGNRQFLVGAGAIGCEMLKNWACMGVGTAGNGAIHLTDLDTIEKSNLNRQFLFAPQDLGKSKSIAAARAVADINPDLRDRVTAYRIPVETESEGKSLAKSLRA